MAGLIPLARAAAPIHTRLSLLAKDNGHTFALQARSYAAPNKGKGDPKPQRQGFKGGKEKQSGPPGMASKKDKHPGAFRPMSVNQLSADVIKQNRAEELTLPAYSPHTLTAKAAGTAMVFPTKDNDPYRIFGLPKSLLVEFRLLSRPCSVVRSSTIETLDILDAASTKSSLETRIVLTGRPGCGKSFTLLQAVQYCASKDWIVLYIPRAINLVNSTTTYVYDLRTRTYLQPVYSYQTLQRLLTVNAKALSRLTTQNDIPVTPTNTVPTGASLVDLIKIGTDDQTLAPVVLEALMKELGQQTIHPVLLAIDDFQALYCKTAYRDPHFVPIQARHLSLPRLLLDYAGGKKALARGAVLGALSTADTTYSTPLELAEALGLPQERPAGAYEKRKTAVVEFTKGLKSKEIPASLSVNEAAALYELWMRDKAVSPYLHDETFMSKYSESSGNPRNFVSKGLLASLDS